MTDGSQNSINRVFSPSTIRDLLARGSSDVYSYVVRRYIDDPGTKTNGQIISEIYSYLGAANRNEYYYTNTLLNKLLVGIHSVNTTTALSQVRVANHIADFVMINGEGCVYEIKSDLDNLERLSDQLYDYYKVFSKVSVLASERERDHVERTLQKLGDMGDSVGIYILSDKGTIFSRTNSRKPREYSESLEHYSLFSLLRKAEYERIILSRFGELPNVPPVYYFKTCLDIFRKLPVTEAQALTMGELKKRNRISKNDFESIKMELKACIYFSKLSKQLTELNVFLQKTYGR